MMTRLGLLVLPALLAAVPAPASASTIAWYNGDFDGANGLANELNTTVPEAYVYDNFLVPLGGWTLDGAFTNNLMSFAATTADVEIRSGVSAGNGGTLVHSAYGIAATQSATGRSGFGLDEFTIQVALPNWSLLPGTYWLMVAPIGSGSGRSFVSTTAGANCVGLPCGDDGNSFFSSSFFGADFAPAGPNVGDSAADFSMGVLATPIPEPATLLLFGAGLAVAGVRRYRQRK